MQWWVMLLGLSPCFWGRVKQTQQFSLLRYCLSIHVIPQKMSSSHDSIFLSLTCDRGELGQGCSRDSYSGDRPEGSILQHAGCPTATGPTMSPTSGWGGNEVGRPSCWKDLSRGWLKCSPFHSPPPSCHLYVCGLILEHRAGYIEQAAGCRALVVLVHSGLCVAEL